MDRDFNAESAKDAVEVPEQVIAALLKTRKAFLLEYLCGFLLLILSGALFIKGTYIHPFTYYLALGLSIISFISAEATRYLVRYVITSEKITIEKGFIKKNKRNINYHPLAFIPDISMRQSRIQRLLNYGTVFIESGNNSFEIKDVDSPQKVMELIEGMIEKTRNKR